MEFFLLFVIAMTLVTFISIVLSEPSNSLPSNTLVEIELNSISLDLLSMDNDIEFISTNTQHMKWDSEKENYTQLLFYTKDL